MLSNFFLWAGIQAHTVISSVDVDVRGDQSIHLLALSVIGGAVLLLDLRFRVSCGVSPLRRRTRGQPWLVSSWIVMIPPESRCPSPSQPSLFQRAVLVEDDLPRAGDDVHVHCAAEDFTGGRSKPCVADLQDRRSGVDGVVVWRRRRRAVDWVFGLERKTMKGRTQSAPSRREFISLRPWRSLRFSVLFRLPPLPRPRPRWIRAVDWRAGAR